MKKLVGLLLLAALPATCQVAVRRLDGSRMTGAAIDALVERQMAAHRVTGLGLAVVEHGKLAYIKAYGQRDVAAALPLTPDTVMTAASLTKAAFSTVVMQLVSEGTLDLDRPIAEYLSKPLPDYPNYADLAGDARVGKITMRMLLSHTSGLPNLRRFTEDKKLHLYFEPGSRYAYSGEGMDLAQFVVEQVRGKGLAELMRERLFEPVGMSRTAMTWEPRFEDNFADRYDEAGAPLGPERRKRADAAGSMQTTLRDYATFLAGLLSGKALPARAREEMLHTQVRIHARGQFPTLSTVTTSANDAIELGYGLGWGAFQTRYGRAFFKEGHDDGWGHYAVCFDRVGSCMLIMTNSSNGEATFDALLRGVLADTFTPLVWENYPAAK